MNFDRKNEGGDRFPATRISVVDAVRSGDPARRALAMESLCAAYWKPVYKYVRLRWNRPADDARDLTQGFFAELIERGLLEKYDPQKSRLRTFLRVCIDSYVANENRAAVRIKRGGAFLHVALDFDAAEGELGIAVMKAEAIPAPGSLDEFFEKEWIRSFFGLVLEDLRRLCDRRGRESAFRLFEEYDLAADESVSYAALAGRHDMPVTDVTNALSWVRKEFRRITLRRLSELCGSREEYEREVRALLGRNAS